MPQSHSQPHAGPPMRQLPDYFIYILHIGMLMIIVNPYSSLTNTENNSQETKITFSNLTGVREIIFILQWTQLSVCCCDSDRVQDMPTQNMASCHIEYFKLKEVENQQWQEGLFDPPLKQVMRPSCERRPSSSQRKEHPYLQDPNRLPEESGQRALLSFLQFPTLSSYPFLS